MTKNQLLAQALSNVSSDELDIIWNALFSYRDECIPEGDDPSYDDEWGDICHIMAKITENLIGDEVEIEGDTQ
jgi:hypothetical protein